MKGAKGLILVFLCGALALLPQNLYGRNADVGDHASITELQISGLQRTRESTVRRIIDLELPARADEIDLEQIRQRLLRSGLFVNDMELTLEARQTDSTGGDDEYALHLQLEDRWTLLALPIASYGNDGWSAGLAVLESNLLGTGTLLLSFGMIRGDGASIDGWNASIGVSGGALQRGSLRPGVFLSAAQGDEELVFPDGGTYRRYLQTRLRGSLNLDYRLTDAWSIGSSSSISSVDVDQDWSDSFRTPDSTLYALQDLSLEFDARRFVSFFQAGPSSRVRYRHGFPLDGGDHFDSVAVRAAYIFAVAERHKLELGADMRVGNEPVTEVQGPRGSGYRTLPSRGTASNQSASGVAEFEAALFSARWGTITLPVFIEGGVYNPDGDETWFYGPGAGFRVYLARVAIPALGFNIAYNLEAGELVAGVALGMSF